MQLLCMEIYKTLNGLNPNYMNEIFVKSSPHYSSRRPHDLMVPRVNQTKFGIKSIQYEEAKLWNHISNSIKSAENLETFKNLSKVGKVRHANAIIANNYQILLPDTNAKQILAHKLEF